MWKCFCFLLADTRKIQSCPCRSLNSSPLYLPNTTFYACWNSRLVLCPFLYASSLLHSASIHRILQLCLAHVLCKSEINSQGYVLFTAKLNKKFSAAYVGWGLDNILICVCPMMINIVVPLSFSLQYISVLGRIKASSMIFYPQLMKIGCTSILFQEQFSACSCPLLF